MQSKQLHCEDTDDGDIAITPHLNHGNFLEFLKFQVCGGDGLLGRHLESAAKNAKYTSQTIQNELIIICGNIILDEIRQAEFYSIIADEPIDSANDEQLANSVRYIDSTPTGKVSWFHR